MINKNLPNRPLNILLIAHAVSKSWGGEAILAYHIFKNLRKKGHNVWLCAGNENIAELQNILHDDFNNFIPIKQSWFHSTMLWLREKAPSWFPGEIFLFCSILHTSFLQRLIIPEIINKYSIDIAHQITPVSPKLPIFIGKLRIPFVYGPMNGGMNYPPNLDTKKQSVIQFLKKLFRMTSHFFNIILPGKLHADCLLVANRRTFDALPFTPSNKVIQFVENGVDLDDWIDFKNCQTLPNNKTNSEEQKTIKFIYIGTLLPGKGAEFALRAFSSIANKCNATLEIIGDYWDEKIRLQQLSQSLGVDNIVEFPGFLPQKECFRRLIASDIFLFPSLIDCGGAVILEAMAAGKPVIAVKWGGAIDYINADCGILIEPISHKQLLNDLILHMLTLAKNKEKRISMGIAGRKRLEQNFIWSKKIDFYHFLYYSLILDDFKLLTKTEAEFTYLSNNK